MAEGIYVHIPFCLNKCNYCDFLSFRSTPNFIDKYVEYLIKEIEMYRSNPFETIYFGGGTPSILSVEQLKKILDVIPKKRDAEITIEVNPKTVSFEKFKQLKNIGFNRVSIGIQSFNSKLLKILGRMHSSLEGEEAYFNARKAGFENISLDLMFSLPEQTLDDLKEDLDHLFKLKPEHFSIYSLIWEEGTPFFEKLQKGELKETENEIEANMFEEIINRAMIEGYQHYEISNFSLKNFESKHNSIYWKNKEYLGVGLGASGYIDNIRYKNCLTFNDYYDNIDNKRLPIFEKEIISEKERGVYKFILGLRLLNEGVSSDLEYDKICKKLEEQGFLYKKDRNYLLTKKGLFFANDVFNEFL